jgi:hypothetical protein
LSVVGEALRETEFRNALFFQEDEPKEPREGEKETDMEIAFFVSVRKIYFFMLAV